VTDIPFIAILVIKCFMLEGDIEIGATSCIAGSSLANDARYYRRHSING
jgi:hypothetical protein